MIVRRIPRYRELVRCFHVGHAQMNIPDLIDGFITWQSTLPCRADQETPFVDEQVFQNRGVCGQAFPSLLSPPPPRTFLRPPQFSRDQKNEKCIEHAESPTETLATQAIPHSILPRAKMLHSGLYVWSPFTACFVSPICFLQHPTCSIPKSN